MKKRMMMISIFVFLMLLLSSCEEGKSVKAMVIDKEAQGNGSYMLTISYGDTELQYTYFSENDKLPFGIETLNVGDQVEMRLNTNMNESGDTVTSLEFPKLSQEEILLSVMILGGLGLFSLFVWSMVQLSLKAHGG